ncbi:MAG TPA: VOC family protein [Gaiellaceae bacterium]|nr:VOC family protein [Gaiellaceae bacterium]
MGIRVLGLVFAGTATGERTEMARFLRSTLGLTPIEGAGVEADLFELPDGSRFAVADPGAMGETTRSIGFAVENLDAAVATLRGAGIEVDEPAENERHRYVHFRAPDGELYELIEERAQPQD